MMQPLKEIEAMEGDTVTLECQVSHAGLPATWMKDGKELPNNDRYTATTDGTYHRLTIKNCTLDEEAEYTVQVASLTSKATVWVEGKVYQPCTAIYPATVESNDLIMGA